MCLIIVSAIV